MPLFSRKSRRCLHRRIALGVLLGLGTAIGAASGASVSEPRDHRKVLDHRAYREEDFLPARPVFARNASCETRFPPSVLLHHRAQGDTDFCFAYSSADLIAQRTGVEVSPLDLATAFYFTNPDRLTRSTDPFIQKHLHDHGDWRHQIAENRRTGIDIGKDKQGRHVPFLTKLEGGVEDTTLLLANANGLCRDRDLPSDGGFNNATVRALLRRLQTELRADGAGGTPRSWRGGAWRDHVCAQDLLAAPARLRSEASDAFNARWLCELEERCGRAKLPVPLLPVTYYAAEDLAEYRRHARDGSLDPAYQRDRLLGALDHALDHGRVVAIGYDFYSLTSRRKEQRLEDGDHSSTIIGRRRIDGKCQYLVRDPVGLECDDYFPRFRRHCVARGHLWITEDELAKSLYSVVYLR